MPPFENNTESDRSFYTPRILSPSNRNPRPALADKAVENIVVRATNWLGDNLMSMPAIYRLHESLPTSTRLHIVCKRQLAPLWKAVDWVDSIIEFDGKRLFGEAKQRLCKRHADAALVLPNSLGAALDVFNVGIPVRVGRTGRGRRFVLTHRLLPAWKSEWEKADFHQLTHYFDLVELLMPIDRTLPDTPLLNVPKTDILTRLSTPTNPQSQPPQWLALAPGAAYGPAKQWPVANFAKIAEKWSESGGKSVVLGTDKEKELGETIKKADRQNVFNLCGQTSLYELMSVLKDCKACVCNDSGIMHLAAALGTPGIAVFGSTNPLATGPLGSRWIVMNNSNECDPCFQRTCKKQGENAYICLRCITPDAVMEPLIKLMNHSPA